MIDIISRSAELSPGGQYRYLLTRTLLFGHGACTFVMLNPSTADGLEDDPTIRRCLGFIQDWGFHQLRVVNLFAWRATYPKDMLKQLDPIGPDGDGWILRACEDADMIVCAWGAQSQRVVRARAEQVQTLLRDQGMQLHHLGMAGNGQPRHPLFLERATQPQEWLDAQA